MNIGTNPDRVLNTVSVPDNFICSSHLGASTHEAQDNVARDVANQIVDYLLTGKAENIVNLNN